MATTAPVTPSPAAAYLTAWSHGDLDAIAGLLDEHVTYAGPSGARTGREACLGAIARVVGLTDTLDVEHVVEQPVEKAGEHPAVGATEATALALSWSRLTLRGVPSVTLANRFESRGGRIVSIAAAYDLATALPAFSPSLPHPTHRESDPR